MEKMFYLLSALLIASLPTLTAQQPDATQLMDRSRDLTMSGNLQSNVTLTITEKNGATRKRVVNMVSKTYGDTEKRMMKFLDPADVRGTAMLIIDNKESQDDMWIYLPALRRTRRIVSTEKGKSFMSSEFTNADMASGSNTDFSISHMPQSGENGLWVIESVPVDDDIADEHGFSRKVTWLEKQGLKIKKIDFYNFDGDLFKTIEILKTQPKTGGGEGYIMTEMYATNHLNGRTSRVLFDELNTSASIPDNTFIADNLSR
ncbi:MAG: outer membrane lipoprotein-sorting protein [Bacteroidales bacterium]|nr:outer membrane lipoprotein-sorting protein [Bacteroidales bacterium]MDT8372965.1 outer membrane lipoprotein-sorting protein [Bacteroidales bacterium]